MHIQFVLNVGRYTTLIECSCGHTFEPKVEYRHRLICGDCTDADVVARVMGGEKADAVVTDPPYGAGLYESDIAIPYEFFANMRSQTDIIAVFGYPEDLCALCVVTDLIPDEWVVWWPTNKNVARGTKLPKSSEHIAIFGEIKDPSRILRARSENRAGRKIAIARGLNPDYCREDDVWIDPCPGGHFNASQRLHHNEKPCSILEKLVLLCSDKGEIVYDPFAGSGTTAVACERLGRKARLVEISPAYCAVTIQRLADMGLAVGRIA